MQIVACVFSLLQGCFVGLAVVSRRKEIKKLGLGYLEMEDVDGMAASYSQYFVPASKVNFDYSAEEEEVGRRNEEQKEEKKQAQEGDD